MNKLLSILIFAAFLGVHITASADVNTIRLICEYSHFTNYINSEKSGAMSSEDFLITVKYSSNGKAVIKMEGYKYLDGEYTGSVKEEQISGEYIGFNTYYTLYINRYSGEIESRVGVLGKKVPYYMNSGKCKPTEKLF